MSSDRPFLRRFGPRRPRKQWWRTAITAAVAIVLVAAALFLPIPGLFLFLPGPVKDVENLVRVGGARTYSSEGKLYMTTVSIDVDVSFAELVEAAIDPHEQVVLERDLTGGRSLDELEKAQRVEMTSSKQHAREVALSALGYGQPHGDGVRVVGIESGSPADGTLQPGDVIVSLDGERVATTCDLVAAISRTEIGEEVSIGVKRGDAGDETTVRLRTASTDGSLPFIGVRMTDVNYRFDPGVSVDFSTGQIAGPSAGLMLTLGLYDRLTPADLTRGRTIAGTGTIDCGGRVEPIGGVTQKVAAAESNGAELFLAPAGNVVEARAAADDIKVVSVSTFDDALEHLQTDL